VNELCNTQAINGTPLQYVKFREREKRLCISAMKFYRAAFSLPARNRNVYQYIFHNRKFKFIQKSNDVKENGTKFNKG
jgi:hypothetical protein